MNKYEKLIQERLNAIIKHWDNRGELKESINYSLLNYGKLCRGTLLLMLLEEFQVDIKAYIDLACAIEMIQTYTLIHDDLPIMDDAKTRRGKKTNHLVFSPGIAMLAGDALLSDAFYIISTCHINSEIKVELIKILSYYIGSNGICYGQVLDINNIGNNKTKIDDIYEIMLNKTASFFMAIFEMVAMIINHPNNIHSLSLIGEKIGLAFQIKDDLNDALNLSIGKDNGIDANKNTLCKINGQNKTMLLYNELRGDIDCLLSLEFGQNSKVKEYINILLK